MMKTILLTGGGTAGHIMPNLALVPLLQPHFQTILYMGGGGMEKTLVPAANLPFFMVESIRFERKHLLRNLKIPFVLQKAAHAAATILKENQVDVVFSKGGYPALPAVLGAKKCGIPLVIHESDLSFGLANRFSRRYATKTLTSFAETKGGVFVGNPIRPELFVGDAQAVRTKYHIAAPKVLLVFGGSLGAEAINRAVLDALPQLTKHYHVVHLTGKQSGFAPTYRYTPLPFSDQMGDWYAASDVVVMRGGANSLAEAHALGKRTVCIPLPKSSASRGDQTENAKQYASYGFVTLLEQQNLTKETLVSAVQTAAALPPPVPVGNQASQRIVSEILELF